LVTETVLTLALYQLRRQKKSIMKYFDSVAPDSGSICSPPKSAFPSLTEISDPPLTLLVVDDDAEVRRLLAEILSSQGYQVLQAENSAEALRVASATATIHLLLT
jgi:PleD family two-component response regulator